MPKECRSFFSGHRSFVYSFILLSVLLRLYSLPPSLGFTSLRLLSVVQTRPGVVCLCVSAQLCNVPELGAAKTRLNETATVSSKELSRCRRRRCHCCCCACSMFHTCDQYMHLSSFTMYNYVSLCGDIYENVLSVVSGLAYGG